MVGDKAVQLFIACCDSRWVISRMEPDYGLDLRIEIVRDGGVTGEECYVQVKGSSSVAISSDNTASVEIRQQTINYWLGKLSPVLVVLVDTSTGVLWFDWLEACYPEYPRALDHERTRTVRLSRCSSEASILSDIPAYLEGYARKQRVTLLQLFRGISVVQMLFHVTELFNICAKHVMFVQSPAKNLTDDEMVGIWQRFYQEFARHDLFVRVPWYHYAFSAESSAQPIVKALESRFLEYERMRASFYCPEDPDPENLSNVPQPIWSIVPAGQVEGGQKLQVIRMRPRELIDNILPTINVIEDLQGLLLHILLCLGRVEFQEDDRTQVHQAGA